MNSAAQSAVIPVPASSNVDIILDIRNLHTSFFLERSTVRAVRGVNLSLARQSTLGIVGESGSGKTTLALLLLGHTDPNAGQVIYRGQDLATMSHSSNTSRRVNRHTDVTFLGPLGFASMHTHTHFNW